MTEKFQAMLLSRRVWVAVAGVISVAAEELGFGMSDDAVQYIVLLAAAWIVGDSLRATASTTHAK